MKKILFPTDGSLECQKALDIAEDLAKKFDSELVILYVFDHHLVTEEEKGKHMIEKAVEYFENRGVNVTSKIMQGYPAENILDEAEKGGYDMVIMCTHGMTAGKRFLLGSVTNKVLYHVTVPILIVR
jgi:nucleotide-binding universal stress UspA family protein